MKSHTRLAFLARIPHSGTHFAKHSGTHFAKHPKPNFSEHLKPASPNQKGIKYSKGFGEYLGTRSQIELKVSHWNPLKIQNESPSHIQIESPQN